MDQAMILELVGYFASLLVLISLLMTSVVKLRIINAIGSAIFAVYALLIHSYPTAVMNAALVVINLVFLIKTLRSKSMMSVAESAGNDSAAAHFVGYYQKDICHSFPGYSLPEVQESKNWLVYADSTPVGLLTGRFADADTLEVGLDYACPSHRDCSVGKYLYGYLRRRGVKRLVAATDHPRHVQYLQKMGFEKRQAQFVKEL